jgi:hypothetical protein
VLPAGRSATCLCVEHFRRVVVQPESPQQIGVAGQENDRPASDAAHFAQAGAQVAPLMHAERSHRGIERGVGEREILCRRIDRRRQVSRPLRTHRRRRFDRCHLAIDRLVGASARTDVEHGPGIAECIDDASGDSGIRTPVLRVQPTDLPVVGITRAAVVRSLTHGGRLSARTSGRAHFERGRRLPAV